MADPNIYLEASQLQVTIRGRPAPLELYYPKCPKCGGPLSGDVRKDPAGKLWHSRCLPRGSA